MNAPATRPPLRRILSGLEAHRRPLVRGVVSTVVVTLAMACTPLVVAWAIDGGVVRRDLRVVAVAAVAYAAASATMIVGNRSEIRAYARFAQGWLHDLRVRLLDHLFRLDLDFFTRERSGRLVSRLTSDVETLQQFAETGVALICRASLVLVVTIAFMLATSPILTAVTLAAFSPLVIATFWYRRRAFRAQLEVRESMAGLLAHVNESIAGIRVVQAYGLEDEHTAVFEEANEQAVAARMRTARVVAAYYPLVEFVQPAATGVVIVTGAFLVTNGRLSLGAVVAFTLYLTRLFDPITQLTELAHMLQASSAAYSKVMAFQDERPRVDDEVGALDLDDGPGAVTFEDVSFRYSNDRPLAVIDVDLDLAPGQRVALVGGSGAGKSTLAKLAARFYDPTAGRVLVDGQDVRTVTGASLRQAVALVPQEGFLFDGTIADNIAVTRPGASRDEVEAACRTIGVLDRLEALPDGLDTAVANRGLSLSAGQRQLVALARAMLADPRVIVLDEATSNLDPATEAAVEAGMRALFAGRTAIVIAHRPSTAWRADRVIVMEGGRVAEEGRAIDLAGRGGAFDRWLRTAPAELIALESTPTDL